MCLTILALLLTGTQRFADEVARKLSIRVEQRGAEDAPEGLKNKSVPFSPSLRSRVGLPFEMREPRQVALPGF
jgi:hypothetical protein